MLEYSRDLAQNPCHMCMPMGGILALQGIAGSMALLHGSQGCSTYMRRHIAEHFNEPVDVASSSLNEKGTVYGGQANLKQALNNVLRVYKPQVVGVLTTCLAETIGEDICRVAGEYQEETKCECRIITAATPGYGGTHVEGYWSTLRELLCQTVNPASRHGGINIIVPAGLSPADLREIKRYLDLFGLEYTLLPDISETMDRPYETTYTKIADGGTSLAAIQGMPGATVTLELGGPVDEKLSPGKWLQEKYEVPLLQLPIPIGCHNTDLFVKALCQAAGGSLPVILERERGRLLDAMIDAHKISYHVRPTVFGDPEMVGAIVGFCAENGMFPRVVASGGGNKQWTRKIQEQLAEIVEGVWVQEKTDMAEVLSQSLAATANLAIGPSVGKYLEEQADIPLVRIGFPIQDRLGAQRILSAGYIGAALLLDKTVNQYLERKHRNYRQDLYDAHFDKQEVVRHAV